MSSTSPATSPEDAGENAVKETTEGATRPFPASGDTRPLTMPLPTSDGVATDVLSTGEAPDGTDQTGWLADANRRPLLPGVELGIKPRWLLHRIRLHPHRSGLHDWRGSQAVDRLGARGIGIWPGVECGDGDR